MYLEFFALIEMVSCRPHVLHGVFKTWEEAQEIRIKLIDDNVAFKGNLEITHYRISEQFKIGI